ncbi:hypothetical protein ACFFX0_00630 [Citricoccus parietis]|uniref:Uncharacterized protein n=1 Tax=Citricoccus parietis TaxID=592307 RepID=A0ABV5FSY5_9MICC
MRRDDGTELGEATAQLPGQGLVLVHGGVRESLGELVVLVQQVLHGFEHGCLPSVRGAVSGAVRAGSRWRGERLGPRPSAVQCPVDTGHWTAEGRGPGWVATSRPWNPTWSWRPA